MQNKRYYFFRCSISTGFVYAICIWSHICDSLKRDNIYFKDFFFFVILYRFYNKYCILNAIYVPKGSWRKLRSWGFWKKPMKMIKRKERKKCPSSSTKCEEETASWFYFTNPQFKGSNFCGRRRAKNVINFYAFHNLNMKLKSKSVLKTFIFEHWSCEMHLASQGSRVYRTQFWFFQTFNSEFLFT